MRLNTPRRLQRMKRLYNVLYGPLSGGASRQRSPLRMTWMMALTTRWSSTRGTPCESEKWGAILRICTSVSQNRPVMVPPPATMESQLDQSAREPLISPEPISCC